MSSEVKEQERLQAIKELAVASRSQATKKKLASVEVRTRWSAREDGVRVVITFLGPNGERDAVRRETQPNRTAGLCGAVAT